MVDVGLGKHSIVLNLRLAEGRAVVADDYELGLARSQSLKSGLVTQSVLARLHHKREARVDGFGASLSFLRHFVGLILFSACTHNTTTTCQSTPQPQQSATKYDIRKV